MLDEFLTSGADGGAVLVVQDEDVRPDVWSAELEELLVRAGHRFGRVDLGRERSSSE
jgi:hypothetical protein